MSKKKSYNNYSPNVESEGSTFVEEVATTATVETPAEETPVEQTTVETVPVVEETPAEQTVETPVVEETPAESAPAEQPTVETPVEKTVEETPVSEDKPAEEEAPADETPAEEETPPKNTYDHDAEMAKIYNVRYAISFASKRFAVLKQMSLNNMYKTYVSNRTCFIACTSAEDYNHIYDFMMNNKVYYNRVEITTLAKLQFLAKLREYTEYAILRWHYY
jgi:hypothetical protein